MMQLSSLSLRIKLKANTDGVVGGETASHPHHVHPGSIPSTGVALPMRGLRRFIATLL
jgi:hypothetical protein